MKVLKVFVMKSFICFNTHKPLLTMYVDVNKMFVWLIFAKKSPLAGLGLYCKFLEQLSNFYVCV